MGFLFAHIAHDLLHIPAADAKSAVAPFPRKAPVGEEMVIGKVRGDPFHLFAQLGHCHRAGQHGEQMDMVDHPIERQYTTAQFDRFGGNTAV